MPTLVEPSWIASLEPRPDLPTRQLSTKWVIVTDRKLSRGLQVNAAACLAATVGKAAPVLVGSGGADASGGRHTGLPWTGCMILAAIAQRVRVYDDYLAELARTEDGDITYYAVSIAGPRPLVDGLTGRFPLLR